MIFNNKYIWVNKESLIDTVKIDSVISFVENNNIDNIFLQVRSEVMPYMNLKLFLNMKK